MARIRANYVQGTVGTELGSGDTTLTATGLADLPEVTAPDVAAITIGDASGFEIVHVTAHTAAATNATILRGQEGTSAGAWAAGTGWQHGPTEDDFDGAASGGTSGGVTDWEYFPYQSRPVSTVRETRTGTWGYTASTTVIGGGFVYNTSNTQNDAIEFSVWVGPGTDTLAAVGQTDGNRAIATWDIDDGAGVYTAIGTQDWYGANVADVGMTLTGIVIADGPMRRKLRARALTRNASSTGWYLSFNSVALVRTA